jgi:hypothetical protein
MILPTKRLDERRCLVSLGAIVLEQLIEPMTISRLWKRIDSTDLKGAILTYDWFVLSLDFLFSIGAVRFSRGLLLKGAPDDT